MLPKGLVWVVLDPKPPKADFCPKTEELPNDGDDEAPKAGVDEAPKADMEPPKAGADEAPKAGVEVKVDDDWVPKTPVEVPPKMEPPVCEPKGVVLPKGLGANGLLLALLACPKTDWDPNGLLDDCPKG